MNGKISYVSTWNVHARNIYRWPLISFQYRVDPFDEMEKVIIVGVLGISVPVFFVLCSIFRLEYKFLVEHVLCYFVHH